MPTYLPRSPGCQHRRLWDQLLGLVLEAVPHELSSGGSYGICIHVYTHVLILMYEYIYNHIRTCILIHINIHTDIPTYIYL